jgi:hypothetical protein
MFETPTVVETPTVAETPSVITAKAVISCSLVSLKNADVLRFPYNVGGTRFREHDVGCLA